jgi:uncharacterized protein
MDRVFLDANVLISAAWSSLSPLNRLWDLPEAELWTSQYAVDEAKRNLRTKGPEAIPALERLLSRIRIHPAASSLVDLSPDIRIVEKDLPVIAAAIEAHSTHFLTGDKKHFGRYYGRTVGGVTILAPADYLLGRR